MRIVNLRKAKAELSTVIKSAQGDAVCVTVHGKPMAVLTGVEGQDIEDILLSWDRRFWREVDKRTEGALTRSVSLATVAKELGLSRGPKSRRKGRSLKTRLSPPRPRPTPPCPRLSPPCPRLSPPGRGRHAKRGG